MILTITVLFLISIGFADPATAGTIPRHGYGQGSCKPDPTFLEKHLTSLKKNISKVKSLVRGQSIERPELTMQNCVQANVDHEVLSSALKKWSTNGTANHEKIGLSLLSSLKSSQKQRGKIPTGFFSLCDPKGKIYSIGKLGDPDPSVHHGDHLFLDYLIGHPNRRGGGSAAIEYLVEEGQKLGKKGILLESMDGPEERFYESRGFRRYRGGRGIRYMYLDFKERPPTIVLPDYLDSISED